jgi:glycolate oxidase
MLNAHHIDELRQIAGRNNVLTTAEDLLAYSYDATSSWSSTPELVVLPQTTQQISRIMAMANAHKIPVTPRGGGTNVSGGSIPVKGGIVLGTARMNRIISIKKSTLTATVEPGLVMQDFNLELAKKGLFYPPDPQSAAGCTMGGTVAENAGGPYGVKYGVTKQYLLGLEVVLASGEIVKLGAATIKNRMGYELATLFAGSEGTLGIITGITVRLLPLPKSQKTVFALFDSVEKAGDTVSEILGNGIIPAKIELLDNWFLRRTEDIAHLGLPVEAEAMLLMQADGDPHAVNSEIEGIIRVCLEMKAREARAAKDEAEAGALWLARKSSFSVVYGSSPTVLSEDITVPRDKIAALVRKCKEIGQKYGYMVPIAGHAGDGNIHPSILTDINNKEDFAKAMQAIEEMMLAALELGGVLSGEHGIGLEKQRFMKMALDPAVLKIMKDIKHLLDPNGILNPGKIWEEQ